jgi:C-terminal processing protease CtpA/Prc
MKKETDTMKTLLTLFAAILLLGSVSAAADPQSDQEQARADYQLMLEEAERARSEAEAARREAVKISERVRDTARQRAEREREEVELSREQAAERARERAMREQEMATVQEELSRAHRELREASREVARAHRELARASAERQEIRFINLGERPVIGVVLGPQVPAGVQITGVSPDGPAEKAGLQTGDILVSISGVTLAEEGGAGRDAIFRVMDETKPGEDLSLMVERDAQLLEFSVTAERREPRAWQSLLRIPEAAPLTEVHEDSRIIVERIEIPDVDEKAIAAQVSALQERLRSGELQEQLRSQKYIFVSPDGEEMDIEGDFEFGLHDFSDVAGHAMREANVWFGLPHAQGLELATVNEGLGSYFKTDRGVLVIRAKEDNAYGLEPGDVVLGIASRDVNSPSDMIRALRDVEPGQEIEIRIKRDRRDKTLTAVVPENRFGFR